MALRWASSCGTGALLVALSCGTSVELGATRADDLPGGASNDAAGGASGSGGSGGNGGIEGSGGTSETDAASDAQPDAGPEPDGPVECRPAPAYELSLLACETPLPQPWTDLAPSFVFLFVNVVYWSPAGDERLIGYVDSSEGCAGVVDGWYFVEPLNPRLIVLCPETCSALRADGGRLFSAIGCPRVRAEPR